MVVFFGQARSGAEVGASLFKRPAIVNDCITPLKAFRNIFIALVAILSVTLNASLLAKPCFASDPIPETPPAPAETLPPAIPFRTASPELQTVPSLLPAPQATPAAPLIPLRASSLGPQDALASQPPISAAPSGAPSSDVVSRMLSARSPRALIAAISQPKPGKPSSNKKSPSALAAFGSLPLSFEENRGQADKRVKYFSRGARYAFFLTPTEAVFALSQSDGDAAVKNVRTTSILRPAAKTIKTSVLRIQLIGASAMPAVTGEEKREGVINSFFGNDNRQWRTNVPTFGKVRYAAVYPGIDLVYYGNQRQLEYDFIVSPQSDPRQIRLRLQGVERASLDAQGNIKICVGGGAEVIEKAPICYQLEGDNRVAVAGRYKLRTIGHGLAEIGFDISVYDRSKHLYIDPIIYSTYLGGTNADQGYSIAADSSGNSYVTGNTNSTNFPTSAGALQPVASGNGDAFVTKLSAAGVRVYSTYLGAGAASNGGSAGYGIAVDSAGNAYVAGATNATNFPTTAGVSQPASGGSDDGIVLKLSSSGGLVYSTYLGGSAIEAANAIAIDSSGNAYVTGNTSSSNFPWTTGVSQTVFGGGASDAFVTKLNSVGVRQYSTYLGGSGDDGGKGISADSSGNVYVTGGTASSVIENVYVEDATPAGATLSGAWTWVTSSPSPYSGTQSHKTATHTGEGNHYFQNATATLAVGTGDVLFEYIYLDPANPTQEIMISWQDASGSFNHRAYWGADLMNYTGRTYVGPLPTAGQWVRLEVPASVVGLQGVTVKGISYRLYGGQGWWDHSGVGKSNNFPTTAGVSQPTYGGGASDAFVTKLDATGVRVYSTYLGGSGADGGAGAAVDATGNVFVTGNTASIDFPTIGSVSQTSSGGAADAFVTKLNTTGVRQYSTYLGGSGADVGAGIAIDGTGNAYITGRTGSSGTQESVYVEDATPTGATLTGAWTWVTSSPSPYSGAQSHKTATHTGEGNHYFSNATATMGVSAGDTLFQYIYLDPANPTQEIMVSWQDAAGTFNHRAYWGADLMNYTGRTYVGPLPTAGQWVRLEVPASVVGLQGVTVKGISYRLYGGQGWWDYSGVGKNSDDFPTTSGALQTAFGGGASDAFVTKLNSVGVRQYSTYLGGSGADGGAGIAIDASSKVYVTGGTSSINFPTLNASQSANAGGNDAFVTQLSLGAATGPVPYQPLPGWAEGIRATHGGGGGGGGPASADVVDLASGSYVHDSGIDIAGRNIEGPTPAFGRSYNTAWVSAGVSSPGFPVGWKHNYDYTLQPNAANGLDLVYPNGAHETIQAMSGGSLSAPAGAPYLVGGSVSGVITVTFLDESVWSFKKLVTSAPNNFQLYQIANRIQRTIRLNYDTTGRITSVVALNSDNATVRATLLTFTYGSVYLQQVTDNVRSQFVDYTIQPATSGVNCLTDVSLLTAGTPASVKRWHYDYATVTGIPSTSVFLSNVKVPDPSTPGGTVTYAAPIQYASFISGSNNYAYVNTLSDANSNTQNYTYAGGLSAQVATKDSGGATTYAFTQNISGASLPADTGYTDANSNTAVTTYGTGATQYYATAVANENGQTVPLTYDPYGRVTVVKSPRTVPLDGFNTNLGTKSVYNADTGAFAPGRLSSVQTGAIKQSDGTFYTTGGNTKGATTFVYYGASDPGGSPASLLKMVTAPAPGAIGGSSTVSATFTYSSIGNLLTSLVPPPDTTGIPASYAISYSTDGAYTRPEGECLGEPLVITDPLNHASHVRYDSHGNVLSVIDAEGNQTDFVYDNLDQLTEIDYPNTGTPNKRAFVRFTYVYPTGPLQVTKLYDESQWGLGSPVAFRTITAGIGKEGEALSTQTTDGVKPVQVAYDGSYRVKNIQDGNGATHTSSQVFNAVGDPITMKFPASSTGGANPDQLAFVYSAAGFTKKRTNGRGQDTTYQVAEAASQDSRVDGVQYSGYTGKDIGLTYDVFNRVISRTDAVGSETYTYDDQDNALTVATSYLVIPGGSVTPPTQTLTYSYFPNGSRYQMGITNGGTAFGAFTYTYDKVGRLTQVDAPWAQGKYTHDYYNNDWLKRTHTVFTSGTYVGFDLATTLYSYNGRGFLTSLTNVAQDPNNSYPLTNSPYNFVYNNMQYDAVGNRKQMTVTTDRIQHAPRADPETVTYTYDQQDRLTGETRTPSISTQYNYSNSIGFDNAGNITSLNSATTTYNANNQIAGYTYNGDGDPTSYRASYSLAYDEENRLSALAASGAGFSAYQAGYRGDGKRAWRTVNGATTGTYFVYDGDTLLYEMEYNGSVYNIKNLYGWGASGLLQRFDNGNAATTTYLYDPSGNLVTRADKNGKPLAVVVYDAFGFLQADKNPNLSDLNRYSFSKPSAYSVGFGGQFGYYTEVASDLTPADGTTMEKGDRGLILCTHRYYDPINARWLTRDPIGYDGGINLYAYCGNNPVTGADPSGLDFLDDLIAGWNHLFEPHPSAFGTGADDSMARGLLIMDGHTPALATSYVFSQRMASARAQWESSVNAATWGSMVLDPPVSIVTLATLGRSLKGAASLAKLEWKLTATIQRIAARKASVSQTEVAANSVMPSSNVTTFWDTFLGSGPRTSLHPRKGTVEDDTIFTQVGPNVWRYVRFGKHEVANPKNIHFNYGEFIYNPALNHFTVTNTKQRIIWNK